MRSVPRTLVLALATLSVAIAAAAGPAQGASRVVIRGAGFGHGVGMSQYGAYGFAQHGADHAAILGHYFSGTQIGTLGGPREVRVLLKTADRIVFRGATSVVGVRRLSSSRRYVATRALDGAVALRSASGRSLGTYRSPLSIAGDGIRVLGRAQNGVRDGRYRGRLLLHAGSIGGLSAIDAVDIEDYLRGVVAGEMPADWADAALRAQAVAARTYAIATTKDGDGFDHYADTRSQVYRGIAGETPSTDAAVAATAGQVVVHDGKPIVTYYFSSSGGRTENVENGFPGAQPAPYLVAVDDPHDDVSPLHRWVRRMSLRSAQRRLGELVRGSLQRIRVLRRGASPRVLEAQVVGSGGRKGASGAQLRARLGLPDTWARFTVITARGSRGDGNPPEEPVDPGLPTGGATPRRALAAAAAGIAMSVARAAPKPAGVVRGRVAGDGPGGGWVAVQRLVAGRWVAQHQVPVRAGGRYRALVADPGRYRVRYQGEAGPAVRVG